MILDEIFVYRPEWQGIADTKLAYLYEVAKQCTHTIIEIGCGDGFYTIALAFGSRDGYKVDVISIDPHTGLATVPIEDQTDEKNFTDSKYIGTLKPIYDMSITGAASSFKGLLKHIDEWGVGSIVKPKLNYSERAFEELRDVKAELVLIDGDHRYHFVKNDFDLYSQLVVPNGYIAFDDVGLAGVDAVIAELEGRADLRKEKGGAFIVMRPVTTVGKG
jgi:SAM-dependent methyltransferase